MNWADVILAIDWLKVLLLIGGFLCICMLFAFHTSGKISLTDLITGDNGKLSLSKFAQCVCLMVSTWGFFVLIDRDKMTEWYFLSYMIAWSGSQLINKWLSVKETEVNKKEGGV